MKVSIIGSGNIAWHIAKMFSENGHKIKHIYSRNLMRGKEIAMSPEEIAPVALRFPARGAGTPSRIIVEERRRSLRFRGGPPRRGCSGVGL